MNWLPVALGAIIMTLILVPLHEWDVYDIKATDAKALKDQVAFDIKQCDKNTQPAIASDSNALQTCTNNLNICLGKLSSATVCVPIIKHTGRSKTVESSASRSAFGLTSNAIEAHNIFCDNQVDNLNGVKDWATECLKNGTCQ